MEYDIPNFHEYVHSFYGVWGLYPISANIDDIRAATDIAIERYGESFVGDSVDRERVRDILLDDFGCIDLN